MRKFCTRSDSVTLQILAGTPLLAPEYRTRAFALLAVSVASHVVLDWLLRTATGDAFPVCWPLTEWRPPAGNWYLRSDRWPAAIAMLLATACGKPNITCGTGRILARCERRSNDRSLSSSATAVESIGRIGPAESFLMPV